MNSARPSFHSAFSRPLSAGFLVRWSSRKAKIVEKLRICLIVLCLWISRELQIPDPRKTQRGSLALYQTIELLPVFYLSAPVQKKQQPGKFGTAEANPGTRVVIPLSLVFCGCWMT
jgi:hypothetical protein